MFGPIFWKIEHGDPLILFHFLTACVINDRFWQNNWHILFDPKLSRTTLTIVGFEPLKTTLRSHYIIRWLPVLNPFKSISCCWKRTDRKHFHQVTHQTQPQHILWNSFPMKFPEGKQKDNWEMYNRSGLRQCLKNGKRVSLYHCYNVCYFGSVSILYSKKFSSAKNFVKSDRPAVRQEFIFVKRRLSLVALRSFGHCFVAYRWFSHSWIFLIPHL